MAIRIQNTTAIDDNKNFYLSRVNMSDATYVNASGGGLRFQLDNPNAFNDVLISSQFGYAVAANENYFAVGVPDSKTPSTTNNSVGAVYVYDQASMKLLYPLYNPITNADNYGWSVSMTSTYLAVGAKTASYSGISSGTVFIYEVASGRLITTINDPNAYSTGDSDYFGQSVSMFGNYIIVGANGEDDAGGFASGKAYIFNVTTGALVWTLNNPNTYGTSDSDEFGWAVAINDTYAAVSTWKEDSTIGSESGTVYIFNISTGGLVWTINNPNAYSTTGTTNGDHFGVSIAISGNNLIVGANTEDGASIATDSGKAYIFNVTTGTLLWTLDNPNAYSTSEYDQFGSSVAISGNYAIVGVYLEDDAGGTSSGKAYIFNVTTGALVWTLNNPNAYSTSVNDQFGYSVAISGNYAFVGATGEDVNVNNSQLLGAVYSFKLDTGLPYGRVTAPVIASTSSEDSFGEYVSISGNYAIVSARGEDELGSLSSPGKAYIFNVTTGALVHTLNNPNAYDTSNADQFGSSVAISGNYAIVGARAEDDAGGSSSGKAYIFNVTTGQLLYTLNNPNAYSTSLNDQFGNSLAISGNYAIAGVLFEDDLGGASSGKAYIFNVTTGQLVWTLNNPNAYSTSDGDFFGASVSISGNYAIVGAYNEDDAGGTSSGKAYIFNVTTGALLWTLNNPNAFGSAGNDYFGSAVAISGNYAIVGAYFEDDAGGDYSGKAYIFNATTGALVHTLNNPNVYSTSYFDLFGYSVAISGNYAVVGAQQEDDSSGVTSSKAYIYNATTGQLLWTLNNPNAYSTSESDEFGVSISISGNYVIAGAWREDDTTGTASGKAYIFNLHTPQIETASSFNGLEKLIDNQTIQTSRNTLLWTLNNPNPYSTSTGDSFSRSISISSNYAIVGAHNEDDAGGIQSGKVYIYNILDGQLFRTINNPNAYATSTDDIFGYSVDISGNFAIIGAYGEDDAGGSGSGKAYIYNVATGTLLWTLNNPNAYSTSAFDYFGQTVAISGNYAIVSAASESDAGGSQSGKAYIFNVTTGALLWTLNNPNAYSTSFTDYFGISVAISGNYAIVGAYFEDDTGGTNSGKAYIYNVTTGQLLWTLNNPNAYSISDFDYFAGGNISISGNYAIVGAYQEDDATGSMSGKAYIYNVTTGQLVWTLNNPNAYSIGTNDNFGLSVAISGNYAIVGVQGEDDVGGGFSGKAYIFNVTTGQLLLTLNNPTAYSTSADDYFGQSVAIFGNYVIVGASNEDDAGGTSSGKAYIYYINNYNSLEDKLLSLFN